jgi:hypothetical protein
MEQKEARHISFLLRLWSTSDGRKLIWRGSLVDPATGERHGFASLEDMFQFLIAETERAEPPGRPSRDVGGRKRREVED